jgi:hypothetical protein
MLPRMKRVRVAVVFVASCVAALALAGCSGYEKDSGPTQTTASATPPPATNVPPTPAPQRLGLVYIDRRAGPWTLFLAGMDGSAPKNLGTLTQGARPLDLKVATLLLRSTDGLTAMNLNSGATVTVPATGNVTFGRLIGDTAAVYAVVSGCGPPGPPNSTLMLADLRSQQQRELASFPTGNLTIIDINAASNVVAVSPRGCDVTTSEIDLVKIADGSKQTFAVQGCGWVAVSSDFKHALASWLGCTRPAAHANADVAYYDLTAASSAGKDLQAPAGGANQQPFIFRPGSAEAALGTSAKISGPGGTTSTGLWVLNAATSEFRQVAPTAGLEQYPVAWSPDGRYLIASSVQAMGLCSYSYLDITTNTSKPIDAAITFCGVNGEVLGWAVLSP